MTSSLALKLAWHHNYIQMLVGLTLTLVNPQCSSAKLFHKVERAGGPSLSLAHTLTEVTSKGACAAMCLLDGQCQAFIYDSGLQSCDLGTSPIIYHLGATSVTSSSELLAVSGLIGGGGGLLLVLDGVYTYDEALAACQSEGFQLYTMKTLEKWQCLEEIVRGYMLGKSWIGLDDRAKEGTFRWADDNSEIDTMTLQWFPFADGQPDNDPNEDCIHIYGYPDGYFPHLNDFPCYIRLHAVCEET